VPKVVTVPIFQKVLQNLLEESVHIRDLKTIVEVLAEHGPRTQDAAELTREARIALSPAIVQQLFGQTSELSVIALDPALEALLMQSLAPGATGSLDPSVAEFLANEAGRAAQKQEEQGLPGCLLVPDRIRAGSRHGPEIGTEAARAGACGNSRYAFDPYRPSDWE
jgi:flagellar biosynthesis protein FlhA